MNLIFKRIFATMPKKDKNRMKRGLITVIAFAHFTRWRGRPRPCQ